MASGSHQKDGNTNSYNSSEACRDTNVDEDDMDVGDKSSASDDDDDSTGFNGAQSSVTSGGYNKNVIQPGNFQHKGASAGNTNSPSARSVSEAKDRTSSDMAEVGEIVQNPIPTCDNHPSDEVEVYCKDCGKAVCFVCSKAHHNNHDCEGILKISRELRKQIPETCARIVDGTLRMMQTELESVRACKRRNRDVYLEEKGSMDKLQEECLNAVKETFKMKTDIFSKQLSVHDEKLKAREEKLTENIEQLDKHVRAHRKSQLSYGKYEVIEMEEKLKKMTREYQEMDLGEAQYLKSTTDRTSKEQLEQLYSFLQTTFPESTRGIFGMPKELCAMQYVEGVKQFSSVSWNPSRSSIKEVHFIDRDDSLVHIVRENFRRFLSTKTEDKASLKISRRNRSFSNVPSPTETKPPVEISSETKKSGNYEFQPFKQLKVFLQVSDIVELSVDVITCPQDKKCEGRGAIAKAIYKKGSDHYKKHNTFSSPLTAGEVGARVSKSPWKFVFHIVSPKNTRNTRSSGRKLEDELQECCLNLMKEANDLKAKSIAIPVLGIGEGGAVEVAETFARAAMSAILKFKMEVLINLEEIYLVSNEEAVIDKMLPILCGEKKMGYKEMEVMPAQAAALSKTGKDFQQAAGMTIHGKQFENEDCCICMDKCTEPKRLRCGHVFCKECIDLQFKYKPACPQCGAVYGKVYGDQPDGTIRIMTWKRALEGYESYGSIEVEYNIPPGKQLENHPNHGTDYEGIKRSGHLPNTDKGRLVCKLLNVAFTRKLVFTIGRSRTTGKDGVVTWNDIHHKTRREGGPQRFGYPDPTYLDRVLEELEVKGVTEELADDPSEYRIYTDAMRYY